jgi:signal transduction histidine kinase
MTGLAGFRERLFNRTRLAFLIADPERLINYGRCVTAVFAVIALYLDPTNPAEYRNQSDKVLAIYLLISIFFVIFPSKRSVSSPTHLFIHVIDIAILGTLAFLTNELTSPFFSFLPFTLMAMTLRWALAGAILGAILLELVLIIIGVPDVLDGESELNFLIMRSAYFLVAAVMLGYFGAYRESSRERLAMLANWPMGSGLGDRGAWLDEVCSHAYEALRFETMIVVWREQEGTEGFVAKWRTGQAQVVGRNEIGVWHQIEATILDRIEVGGPKLLTDEDIELLGQAISRKDSVPFSDGILGVGAGFSGLRFKGMICLIAPACDPEDAMLLARIVATRAGSELERTELVRRQAESVQAAERSMLAQNLHDSVLQDLTAIRLKLHGLVRSGVGDSTELKQVETLVSEQQMRIRNFVEDQWDRDSQVPVDLVIDLKLQSRLLEEKWNIPISFSWQGPNAQFTRAFTEAIAHILSEATANSVVHGKADGVTFSVANLEDALEIALSDNGIGLGPKAGKIAPASLLERISRLGGSIELLDNKPGLRIVALIPTSGVTQ